MPRARTAVSILAVLAALSLAACGMPEPMPTPTPTATALEPSGDGVLRVATVLSSSDPATAAQVAGVEVAVREINEAGGWGGVPVQAFHRNAGEDEASAVAAVQSLAELDIDVLIAVQAVVDAAPNALVISPARSARELSPQASAALLGSDPGLVSFNGAAEAHDAIIAAALAATVAGDDGGRSIEAQLKAVRNGVVVCGSYAECLDALEAGFGIALIGWSGAQS